jgi:hypothetical protein
MNGNPGAPFGEKPELLNPEKLVRISHRFPKDRETNHPAAESSNMDSGLEPSLP